MNDFEKIKALQKSIVDAINGSGLPLTTVYYVLGDLQQLVINTVKNAGGDKDADPDNEHQD